MSLENLLHLLLPILIQVMNRLFRHWIQTNRWVFIQILDNFRVHSSALDYPLLVLFYHFPKICRQHDKPQYGKCDQHRVKPQFSPFYLRHHWILPQFPSELFYFLLCLLKYLCMLLCWILKTTLKPRLLQVLVNLRLEVFFSMISRGCGFWSAFAFDKLWQGHVL